MSVRLRDRQLQRCCDALSAVEADAPTLCAGWTAYDLATHLWMLSADPLSWPMIALPPLSGALRRRMDRFREGRSYATLVAELRRGSGAIRCMPLDRWEDYRHALGEYYVHTQDVARPNGVDQEPPDADLEDELWLRVRAAARILHRRSTPGLVLARPGGTLAAVTPGDPGLVVTGEPTELMCWVYGRREVASVSLRTPAADEALPRVESLGERVRAHRPWWS